MFFESALHRESSLVMMIGVTQPFYQEFREVIFDLISGYEVINRGNKKRRP